MKSSVSDNLRGLAFLLPLLLLVVAALFLVRHRRGEIGDPLTVAGVTGGCDASADTVTVVLSPFDPNEADFHEMVAAGVPRRVAVNLIKWRTAGKVYRIAEDVALCYGVSDSLYDLLAPYIIIGERYAIHGSSERGDDRRYADERPARELHLEPFLIDTASAAYLRRVGFSKRQAELLVRYRDMIGGIRDMEEFRECYAVTPEMADTLAPYIIFPAPAVAASDDGRIELNSADSATLRSVWGIGEKSVADIIRYRELLGGYHSVVQLAELKTVTEANFEKISKQIYCDSCKIRKIDINFASPKSLAEHPYVSDRALRRIVKQRQLKGGWVSIEEMIDDDIFSPEEAARLAPYLRFGTTSD